MSHGPAYDRLLAIVRAYDRNAQRYALGHTPVLRISPGLPGCADVVMVCDANNFGVAPVVSAGAWDELLVRVDELLATVST